jgi:hypothetical protein
LSIPRTQTLHYQVYWPTCRRDECNEARRAKQEVKMGSTIRDMDKYRTGTPDKAY